MISEPPSSNGKPTHQRNINKKAYQAAINGECSTPFHATKNVFSHIHCTCTCVCTHMYMYSHVFKRSDVHLSKLGTLSCYLNIPHCRVTDVCVSFPVVPREEGGDGWTAGVLRRTNGDQSPRPPSVTAHTYTHCVCVCVLLIVCEGCILKLNFHLKTIFSARLQALCLIAGFWPSIDISESRTTITVAAARASNGV